jgi:hypothetical protein
VGPVLIFCVTMDSCGASKFMTIQATLVLTRPALKKEPSVYVAFVTILPLRGVSAREVNSQLIFELECNGINRETNEFSMLRMRSRYSTVKSEGYSEFYAREIIAYSVVSADTLSPIERPKGSEETLDVSLTK